MSCVPIQILSYFTFHIYLFFIGRCEEELGNYLQAMESLAKSHEMYKRLKNDAGVKSTARSIARVVRQMNQ